MTTAMMDQNAETVSFRASEWLVLLESGQATAEDRRRFAAWLAADPSHAHAYRETASFWAGLDKLNHEDVEDLDHYLIDEPRARPWPGRNLWKRLPAIAAAILLLAGASLWLVAIWNARGDYHTAQGEQQTVILADGSTLHLNTDTAVSVTLDGVARKLTLHRGEALFTVAPDAARPFDVTAGGGTIRALGTVFNVRADHDRVRVTVTEHRVRIKTREKQLAELQAGEQVSYDSAGGISPVESADAARTLAWQRHRLIFENQPLTEVLEELGRYRSGWIILRDPELRALSVTGVFDTHHPDRILTAIEESLPIRMVKVTDQFILLYRGQPRAR